MVVVDPDFDQWVMLIFVALLLVFAVTPVSATGLEARDSVSTDNDFSRVSRSQTSLLQNNSTVIRHRNPEEITPSTDLAEIQEWLSQHLGTRLRNSTVRLSQDEYALARRVIGDEYTELLEKYVDVAGETHDDSDNEAGDAFQSAQSNQRKLSSAVQEYRETHERYQEAQENENTANVRRIARQLEQQSQRVNETTAALLENYRTISTLTGIDLSGARQRVRTINQRILSQQIELQQELFITTRLTGQVRSTEISYQVPLYVTGQLTTVNGTPLSDRRIQLQVGNRTLETRTNANGSFVFTYRPTLLSLNTSQVRVRYLPLNTSIYRSSQTTLAIEVVQVTPTITVDRDPSIGGFSDEISVTGRLTVSQTGIQTVPVAITLDDSRLKTVRTNTSGGFNTTVTLGADILPGDHVVRVFLPVENQALSRGEATTTIRVVNTSTVLTLSGSQTGVSTIRASGRLTTANGTPVAGQPIEFRINRTSIERTTTTQDGEYSTSLRVPQRYFPTEGNITTVRLVGVYEADRTNLNRSRAEEAIELTVSTNPLANQDEPPQENILSVVDRTVRQATSTLTLIHWIIIGITGGAITVGMVLAYIYGYLHPIVHFLTQPVFRRIGRVYSWFRSIGNPVSIGLLQGQQDQEPDPTDDQPTDGQTTSAGIGEGSLSVEAEIEEDTIDSVESLTASLLNEAQDYWEADNTEKAIATAYMAVRQQFGEEMEIETSLTHREFLRTCRENGLDDDRLSILKRFIDHYERAAFTPETMPSETAEEAIAAARTLTSTPE